MRGIISASLFSLLLSGGLIGAAGGLAAGCAEPTGELRLTVRLRDAADQPLQCEDLGAESIRLTLYQRAEDTVPYEQLRWRCASDAQGRFGAVVRLAEGTYHHGVLQLLSAADAPVRVCSAQGTTRDGFALETVAVRAGERQVATVTVDGDPGRCLP